VRRLSGLVALLLLAAALEGCLTHYVVPGELRALGPRARRPRCRAANILAELSLAPQEPLGDFDRAIAPLTTPLKESGVSGWTDTGCSAVVTGTAIRQAQRSSGGWWTLDPADVHLAVGRTAATPPHRYIRVEVAPETTAAKVAGDTPIGPGTRLEVAGPVLVDTDGPFLEVHPDADLRVVRSEGTSAQGAPTVSRQHRE
jgi:hypothetical protein